MHDWGVLTQAQRDARYNNSEAVKDSQPFMAALRADSAARRAEAGNTLDVPYGPKERNKVDFYPGHGAAEGAPCCVHVHGGYWQRNEREAFAVLGDGIRAHGWNYAVPGYTLTPEATMTELVGELRTALDFIKERVTGPLVLTGWSAGGHLTAVLLGHAAVHAGLAISGVFELGPIRDTYLNEKARITEAEADMLSPMRQAVVPKPLSLAYGSAELPPLVGDSRALHWKRSDAHAAGSLIPGPGQDHFTILHGLRTPDGLLTRALLDLV